MKVFIGLVTLFFFSSLTIQSQDFPSKSEESNWNVNSAFYFYFVQNDFFLLPIVKAENDELHLEARYNYEDRKTVSTWVGYNYQIGGELEFTAVPMIAAVFGQSNGIAPGLELDLVYKSFELYSEAEYFFNIEDGHSNFFYDWSELTFSPTEWLWFGVVGQRTRVYQTEREIQRGLLLGTSYKNWQLAGYFFNLFSDDDFIVISLAVDF